jgi:hypothetical protein
MSMITVEDGKGIIKITGEDKKTYTIYQAIVGGSIVSSVKNEKAVSTAGLAAFYVGAKDQIVRRLEAIGRNHEPLLAEIRQGLAKLPK